jgi:cold-inducible RNA-binding protein
MGKKLYVGNLPFTTTDQDLNEMFAEFGQVTSAKIIMDRDSGRSKGFGFVEMTSDQEAEKAISHLNGAEMNGRPLTVNEARPMSPRPIGGANNGFDRGGRTNRFSGNRNDRNSRW